MRQILQRVIEGIVLCGCATGVAFGAEAPKLQPVPAEQPRPQLVISIADQRLALVCEGGLVHQYPVSTSKFGAGDSYGSYRTPLGKLRIADKIGDNLTPGAVIKHRSATGEVLKVNAPGRDPIVTRIMWLDGMEAQNRRARERGIYIHGTPEEKNIGEPVSWGCIRMRSKDVIELFNDVPVGADVTIIAEHLPRLHRYEVPKPRLACEGTGARFPFACRPSRDGCGQPTGTCKTREYREAWPAERDEKAGLDKACERLSAKCPPCRPARHLIGLIQGRRHCQVAASASVSAVPAL